MQRSAWMGIQALQGVGGHRLDHLLPLRDNKILTHDGLQEEPCEAMHADNSTWISHKGEPSIWLLLVAQRGFAGPHVRDAVLLDILKRMHAVIKLLHGSVQRLLDAVSAHHKGQNLLLLLSR